MLAQRSDAIFTRCRLPSRGRPVPPILWLAAGLLGALGIGGSALGATPVGSEFQVNTYTTGSQLYPAVAVDADGDFVVVWQSEGSAGSDPLSRSIQGQRYEASGNAVGAEFQVNTYTTGWQQHPSVTIDPDGDFVVVWESEGSAGSDASSFSIQGQRYDASGNAVGAEFQVNTYTTNGQRRPSVAVDADGNFVVVWQGPQIQAQRYDSSGNPVGTQFQVNTYESVIQDNPSVAVDADGGFVVAWDSEGSPGSDTWAQSIQAQRYDASGNAVGAQFQVNTYTSGWQQQPSVAVDVDGDFVVVWDSLFPDGFIQGQRYDASGNAVGAEFVVVPPSSYGYRMHPSVAADAGGDFVVVWETYYRFAPDRWIAGKHYDANGDVVGTGFQINNAAYLAGRPGVAADGNGCIVVVWDSYGSSGDDYGTTSIQGRRYTFQAPQAPSLTPPGVSGLALLLFGIAAAALRGRLRERA